MQISEHLRNAGLSTRRFFIIGPTFHPSILWGNTDNRIDAPDDAGNWGCACGDGLFVIDLDDKKGRKGSENFHAACVSRGLNPPATLAIRTKSGGTHLYYRLPSGYEPHNTAGRIKGVDTRGTGGYVNCPPSLGYRIVSDRAIAVIPESVLSLFSDAPKPVRTAKQIMNLPADHYSFAINNALARIKHAPEGERNDTLYRQALAIAKHCVAISEGFPADMVISAGQYCGLSEAEINATVASAIKAAEMSSDCEPFRVGVSSRPSISRPAFDASVGGLTADQIAEKIKEIANQNTTQSSIEDCQINAVPVLRCAADIEPQCIDWLWPSRFALGRLHMVSGRAGVGKSTLTCAIAAHVSNGMPFIDSPEFVPPIGSVIMVSLEDSADSVIVPRLRAAGANMANVHILNDVKLGGQIEPFTLRHVHALRTALELLKGSCRLIIIDPIGSVLAGADSYKDTAVREALQPLKVIAEEYDAACILVGHLRKGASNGSAQDMQMGSQAFMGLARIGHMVAENREKTRVNMICVKNNLAFKPSSIAYKMAQYDDESGNICGRAEFIGLEDVDADDLFSDPALSGGGRDEDRECREWLLDHLSDYGKPIKKQDLDKESRNGGYSGRSYQRVLRDAIKNGEVIKSQGFSQPCYYSLPLDKYKKHDE